MKQDLREYGFIEDYNTLRCRKCGSVIHKYGITILWLGNKDKEVTVKFGWCRWYTHGISVCKLMK